MPSPNRLGGAWRRPTRGQFLLLLGVLAITMLGVVGIGLLASPSTPAGGTAPGATTPGVPAPGGVASPTPRSDLPGVAVADLPQPARDTLALIDRGGPYPYDQDNTTFSNLERLLPEHPAGYYREYTVVTPGSANRGTRRLVVGAAGDIYYTADHYETFRQVLR